MKILELLEKIVKTGSELNYIEIIKGHEHHIMSLKSLVDDYPEYLGKEVKKFDFKTYEEYSDDIDVPPYVKYSCKVIEVEVE